jgi:hypothetical protein
MRTSESIGKISEALAKAQGQMKNASFDAVNPHFKSRYASLSSIIEASRQILSANNIAVVQGTSVADGKVLVETMLIHSSGEFISETLAMTITKDTPQAVGSAITYARRYGLSSMICLSADEDDDAESTKPDRTIKAVKTVKPSNKVSPIAGKNIHANKNNPQPARAKKAQADRVQKIRTIFSTSAKLGHTPNEMKEAIGQIIGLQRPIKESAEIKDADLDLVINTFNQQLEMKMKEAA